MKERGGLAVLALLALVMAAQADEMPSAWRKTMVNDPAKNYPLRKYSQVLNTPEATAGRNILLANMLGAWCKGSSIDSNVLKSYQLRWPVNSDDELREAVFQAESSFRQFDYRELAHLCAGVAYLFGTNGVLIPNAVSTGRGEPEDPYDPNNPYVKVPTYRY